jgi:hypothetical protein
MQMKRFSLSYHSIDNKKLSVDREDAELKKTEIEPGKEAHTTQVITISVILQVQ